MLSSTELRQILFNESICKLQHGNAVIYGLWNVIQVLFHDNNP